MPTHRLWLRLLTPCALYAGGCDGGAQSGGSDASVDAPGMCASDLECSDGLFCNGPERCQPADPMADARGCTPAPAEACAATERCVEDENRCDEACAVERDADGDGHVARACGGDDCDDDDATRYPGNLEICDTLGHDEDCDPASVGHDLDRDGFVDSRCCNELPDGAASCGDDCDDRGMSVNPAGTEACNGVDDDCDGDSDEGVLETFHRDIDADGYGTDEVMLACSRPVGHAILGGDCNDGRESVHPGATEVCEGVVDDDCDGTVDEGCACTTGSERDCGPMAAGTGICRLGRQSCIAGVWAGGCEGAVRPTDETCDGRDEDCDGTVDEDPSDPTTYHRDADGDGHGRAGGIRMACSAPTGYVTSSDDCDDTDPAVYPGATELCDLRDNDCSSGGGLDASEDADGDGYAPIGAPCVGGPLPATDCRDDITAVSPAHSTRETLPACIATLDVCHTYIGPCGDTSEACDEFACGDLEAGIPFCAPERAPAHWDWNCSGAVEKPPNRRGLACVPNGARCEFEDGSTQGFAYRGETCGSTVPYWECGIGVDGSGMMSGCAIYESYRPLPCR